MSDLFLEALAQEQEKSLFDPAKVWVPLPTQQKVMRSMANRTLFGGSAGGSKSDLLAFIALYVPRAHGIMFRREFRQMTKIRERMKDVLEPHGGVVTQFKATFPNDAVINYAQFGKFSDIGKWRGQAHELLLFDELTEMSEPGFRSLHTWLRSARGIRTRSIAASNPPVLDMDTGEVTGDWVIEYWAPWLSDEYTGKRAMPEELRWFVRGYDEDAQVETDIEVDSGDPIHKSDLGFKNFVPKGDHRDFSLPHSRTYIPSRVSDNPHLAGTEYERELDNLPSEMRAALRDGEWNAASVVEDPGAIIPMTWWKAAKQRWLTRVEKEGNPPKDAVLTVVGVDPSRGGKDATVITHRYVLPDGTPWIGRQRRVAAVRTPNGDSVAALVREGIERETARISEDLEVRVDAIGIGAAVVDALSRMGDRWRTIALNGSRPSTKRVQGAAMHAVGLFNKRTEWYWLLREGCDPYHGAKLEVPPDKMLTDEIRATKWENKTRGIIVNEKDKIRQRVRRSPDNADSLSYALADPTQFRVMTA